MRAIAVLALCAAAGCATGSIYTKGPPRRIETSKRATAPGLWAAADPREDGAVTLEVRWQTEVTVRRQIHYGTVETRHEHGNPWVELYEVPIGLVMALVPGTWAISSRAMQPIGLKEFVIDYGRAPMLKFANPFVTFSSGRMRPRISARELWTSEPMVRRFGMKLPASNARVAWRALDVAGDAFASGQVTTDEFGRAELVGVPASAIALEVRAGGQMTIAPLARPLP